MPKPLSWSDNTITACWIGHATVLINFYGVRILTDPVFGARVGVSLGLGTAGPKRHTAAALGWEDLPRVDLILLSHAHMDHMDLPSLRCFDRSIQVVTAKQTSDVLGQARFRNLTELAWGERTELKIGSETLEIKSFEVKHWGERWPSEKLRGYNGYLLRREGKSILFGGDTAMTPLFSQLRSRSPFEIALMPIGAYRPWITNHCTPEEAVELSNLAGARYILPIHHQTFKLSHEPLAEPIERFKAALDSERERIALTQIGETFVCPRT